MATGPLVAEFKRHGVNAEVADDISNALHRALALAKVNDLICVAGSLFVVAGAIEQAQTLPAAVDS